MADVWLIDANALLNKADYRKCRECGDEDNIKVVTDDDIYSAPTIDAVEVVHGRWEWYEDWGPSTWLEPPDLNNAGWKCSNCGIDLGDYLTDCLGVNVYVDEEDKMPKIKRCPNCGAKMDLMHKCETCKYCGEHQEMGFGPVGVCHLEHNLLMAIRAYNAKECPFKDAQDMDVPTKDGGANNG